MKLLITGAAGFIGHHVVDYLLRNSDHEMVLLDKLTYASNGFSRLREVKAIDNKRVRNLAMDLVQGFSVGLRKEIGNVDVILHMAAETHVDNSIKEPKPFVISNVLGTFELLEYARSLNSRLQKFIYFSTDEVFGPIGREAPSFHAWSRYNSTNPYSATKAAGEELCLAWANTYKMPMVIVHCMNAFGERQHPEKFIPTIARKLLRDETITVHTDRTRKKPGSRFYIHCQCIASAVAFLLENTSGAMRDKFNIRGQKEVDNLELVKMVHRMMCKALKRADLRLDVELTDFHSTRPGHDLRYALDGEALAKMGWTPPENFEEYLEKTVSWMVDPRNLHWLMLE